MIFFLSIAYLVPVGVEQYFCRIMWLYFINKVTYQRAKINDGNIFKAGIWSYESKKAELSKSAVHKSIA